MSMGVATFKAKNQASLPFVLFVFFSLLAVWKKIIMNQERFCNLLLQNLQNIQTFANDYYLHNCIYHYWPCLCLMTNISSFPFSGFWTHKSPSRLCCCNDQASTRWTWICVLKDHSALSIWWISLNCYVLLQVTSVWNQWPTVLLHIYTTCYDN